MYGLDLGAGWVDLSHNTCKKPVLQVNGSRELSGLLEVTPTSLGHLLVFVKTRPVVHWSRPKHPSVHMKELTRWLYLLACAQH